MDLYDEGLSDRLFHTHTNMTPDVLRQAAHLLSSENGELIGKGKARQGIDRLFHTHNSMIHKYNEVRL